MASGLKTAVAAGLLNLLFRGTAYTAPSTPLKVELTTTAPTATTNGTAVTGGTYADQTYTIASGTATNSISNSSVVAVTGMPATTTVGANIKDSAGTPVYEAWGTFATAITTASGDTVSFAVGAIAVSLTNTP